MEFLEAANPVECLVVAMGCRRGFHVCPLRRWFCEAAPLVLHHLAAAVRRTLQQELSSFCDGVYWLGCIQGFEDVAETATSNVQFHQKLLISKFGSIDISYDLSFVIQYGLITNH
eukprot:6477491-Amphidinium_carterae.1